MPPGTSTGSPHHRANFQESITAFTALAAFLAVKPLARTAWMIACLSTLFFFFVIVFVVLSFMVVVLSVDPASRTVNGRSMTVEFRISSQALTTAIRTRGRRQAG